MGSTNIGLLTFPAPWEEEALGIKEGSRLLLVLGTKVCRLPSSASMVNNCEVEVPQTIIVPVNWSPCSMLMCASLCFYVRIPVELSSDAFYVK